MSSSAKNSGPDRAPRAKTAARRRLSANMEDYLEAIYRLSGENGVSRVSSIAEAVGVKRPSVSKALKWLQREGLVTHTPYGGAAVTVLGKQVAQAQVKSHRALTRFLEQVLALRPELAEHDACLMEHAISPETVERLVQFIDYLDQHASGATREFRATLKLEPAEIAAGGKRHRKKKESDRNAPERVWTSRV
ncbi:MAG TPA: metal-dependent transcriptional regulator [Planctomycetota bacterium]|nr:metal-dependent transcriptional regulator [Planctomycetota bacterium]